MERVRDLLDREVRLPLRGIQKSLDNPALFLINDRQVQKMESMREEVFG